MQLQAGTVSLNLDGIEAFIFDLDGTLVESEHVWAKAKLLVASKAGRTFSDTDLAAFVGRSVSDFAAEGLGLVDRQASNDAVDQITGLALGRLEDELTEIPGASRLIRDAHDVGLRIAICSSAPEEAIRTSVRALGVIDQIEIAVSSANMELGKPDKQPYLETLNRLGLQPEHVIAFEDSPAGIRSAVSAGIPTVAVGGSPTDGAVSGVLATCRSVGDIHLC